jgi:hypothetical protein
LIKVDFNSGFATHPLQMRLGKESLFLIFQKIESVIKTKAQNRIVKTEGLHITSEWVKPKWEDEALQRY